MKKIIFDIVYTWVDFTNEKWKQDYNYYYNKINKNTNYKIMNRSNTNLCEIKYSLRSIEKYLKIPINKIYIVTNYGSKPSFLKDNDKIVIIDYTDLLGKISFNSQSIESVIHTIPNLNEYFFYFNDDCILNNYIYQNDLINKDGKLIWYSESNFFINMNSVINIDIFNLDSGVSSSRKYTYDIIFKKCNIVANQVKPLGHSFRIFSKKMIEMFINEYQSYIDELRNTMFRTNKFFCFIDGFCLHYMLNNMLEYRDNKNTLILVQTDNYSYLDKILNFKNIYSIYFNKSYDFICIEDIRENNLTENQDIKLFMENEFNKKSKFEK